MNDDCKASDFLIVEFETIRDFVLNTKETGNKRINFLVGIGTSIGGLFAFFFEKYHELIFYKLTFVFAFGILFVFAINIFLQMGNRRIVTIEYLRAMNRIRRYFLDKNEGIKKYLYFPVSDEEPSYINSVFKFSGLHLVSILLSVVSLWGFYIGLINILSEEVKILNTAFLLQLILAAFVLIIWCIYHIKRKNKEAHIRFKINFPILPPRNDISK